MNKNFLLTLHAHIPYVLDTEAEYWLYEAMINSYIPFLKMLADLESQEIYPKITLNISPILLLQIDVAQERFQKYLTDRSNILSHTLEDENIQKVLSEEYCRFVMLTSFMEEKFDNSIIQGFKYFQQVGVLNILTSAFTHLYLPTYQATPHVINHQISTGKAISEYYFGEIKGFWSPECGTFPDLPYYLSSNDISYFFADPAAVPNSNVSFFEHDNTTFFTRNHDATNKIWDASSGYPGNSVYKEFHTDLSEDSSFSEYFSTSSLPKAGISLYKVTNKNSHQKSLYIRQDALFQAQKDAEEYANYLKKLLSNEDVAIFFDMELFGHWWYEGNDFLCFLLQRIAPMTKNPQEFEDPQTTPLYLSSWGMNSNSESWINHKTQKYWSKILTNARDFEQKLIANLNTESESLEFCVSNASDWLFLITYGSFVDLSTRFITQKPTINPNILKKFHKIINLK